MRLKHFLFKRVLSIYFMTLVFAITGCKKFIAVDAPYTNINAANVYTVDATAISAVTGIYATMSASDFTSTSTTLYQGLSSDELSLWSGITNNAFNWYYTNSLTNTNTGIGFWGFIYPNIFAVNDALEGLGKATSLTPAIKQQLIGEAKFMRAFFYFHLVNLYGDVVLVTGTDPQVNRSLSRSSTTIVYQQIINDLKDAQNLLSSNYLNATLSTTTAERVRPTKWAATALLARVYLYTKDWVNAEAQASAVINNSSQFSLASLNNVFLKNSTEAIWQLQPVASGWNTRDARLFIIPATGLNDGNPVYLSNNLLNSFESGDQRSVNGNWIKQITLGTINYYYPYKYKSATQGNPVTEYEMILRLGEQYLIRAEARAQQNNISGAQTDLNAIRTRAVLGNTSANDKASLLTAILHERQVELFTEWGHRWFDLRRTGNLDAVMSIVTPTKASGAPWKPFQQLYPIPADQLIKDPNLTQNPGY